VDQTPTIALLAAARVNYRIDGNVYRKSTGRQPATMQLGGFCWISSLRAYYHQQYLAKNPDGYCGIGGCGVPFESAELQL